MEEELNQVLKNRARETRKRWRCADERQLAAYVDGALDAKSRHSLEAHLADCQACLSEVSFLMQASEWKETPDVPPWLVTKAKNLVSERRKASVIIGWRWATATFAAVLAVAFLVAVVIRLRNPSPDHAERNQSVAKQESPRVVAPAASPTPNPEAVVMASPKLPERLAGKNDKPDVSLIRNHEPKTDSPKLLFPRDGAVIRRDALELRWRGIPETVFYEVSIVTASGEVVMSRQTEASSLTMPAEVQLTPGQKYFVSVRAHLRDGKTARSRVVSFRLAE